MGSSLRVLCFDTLTFGGICGGFVNGITSVARSATFNPIVELLLMAFGAMAGGAFNGGGGGRVVGSGSDGTPVYFRNLVQVFFFEIFVFKSKTH